MASGRKPGRPRNDRDQQPHPPHSVELEQQVLGAALFFPADHLPSLLDTCKPDDFYVPVHAKLLQLMAAAYTRHQPIDVLALRCSAGANQPLVECIDAMQPCLTADIGPLCDEVAALATNRRTIQTAFRIAEQGLSSGPASSPFFEESQKLVASMVADGRARSAPQDAADLASGFLTDLERPIAATTFVRTGLSDLDRRLGGGLESGRLYVIAGRPGMGKSALAFQSLLRAAKDGHRALGFTLEMPAAKLQARLVAHETGIDTQAMRARLAAEAGRITAACSRLAAQPYALVDDPRISVQHVRVMCRRERARRGLKLVVVDYLQLMASEGRHDSREQEVASISRELKKLALELDVAVIAAAQLNRGLESRADKHPMLSDLRESGAIEQDADVVMLLYRDDYYDENSKEKGICDIGIAKNRDGETGVVRVLFEPNTTTFKALVR